MVKTKSTEEQKLMQTMDKNLKQNTTKFKTNKICAQNILYMTCMLLLDLFKN